MPTLGDPDARLFQPGQAVFAGKYRIEIFVGAGAFAQVYRVVHAELNVLRAIKALSPALPGIGSTLIRNAEERFRFEAQLGAQINHPSVVQVYDIERDGDVVGLVMEYCRGGSLLQRLADARNANAALPVSDCVRWAREVAAGLAHLHAHDIVHRDVKPSNVLLDHDGHAKVADLGLAQAPNNPLSGRSLMGSVAAAQPGTPQYMSPEQSRSEAHLTPASDIYSLGCLLFELLTGRAYRNQRPGTRAGDLRAGVAGEVDDLLSRMLAEQPGGRPWDGSEAERELASVLSGMAAAGPLAAARAAAQDALAREAWAEAQTRAEAWLKLAPGDPEAMGLAQAARDRAAAAQRQAAIADLRAKAEAALARDAVDEAQAHAEAWLRLAPADPGAIALVNMARDRAQRARETAARDAQIADLRAKGAAALARGAWAEAQTHAAAWRALAASDAGATALEQSALAGAARDREAAAQQIREQTERNSEVASLRAKGLAALERGDGVAAIGAADAWLRLAPKDPEAAQMEYAAQRLINERTKTGQRDAQIAELRNMGQAALAQGKWSAAQSAAEAWLQVAPDDAGATTLLQAARDAELAQQRGGQRKTRDAQIAELRQQGENALKRDDWNAAQAAAADWLTLVPGDGMALALAQTARDLGAAQQRNAAQKARETQIAQYRANGDAALKRGDWAGAHAAADGWYTLAPGDAAALALAQAARDGYATQQRAAQARPAGAKTGSPGRRHPVRRALLVGGAGIAACAIGARVIEGVNWMIETGELRRLISTERAPATFTPAAARAPTASPTRLSSTAIVIRPGSATAVARPSSLVLTIGSGVALDLVVVPAGDFSMGGDTGLADEKPRHKLTLPEFWIGKTKVTVAQFAAFVKATGYKTQAERDGTSYVYSAGRFNEMAGADWAHPGGPSSNVNGKQSHPVTHVSWDDGMAFCVWAGQTMGASLRLPSEAQWEKAARGTDGRLYPWGNEAPDATRCNFNNNEKDTTPVGKYGARGASPYGCDDMAGNVWEWTRSLWGKDVNKPEYGYPYTDRQAERENAQAGTDVLRVLRGGSFLSDAQIVRCALRDRNFPFYHYDSFGFRVVVARLPSL